MAAELTPKQIQFAVRRLKSMPRGFGMYQGIKKGDTLQGILTIGEASMQLDSAFPEIILAEMPNFMVPNYTHQSVMNVTEAFDRLLGGPKGVYRRMLREEHDKLIELLEQKLGEFPPEALEPSQKTQRLEDPEETTFIPEELTYGQSGWICTGVLPVDSRGYNDGLYEGDQGGEEDETWFAFVENPIIDESVTLEVGEVWQGLRVVGITSDGLTVEGLEGGRPLFIRIASETEILRHMDQMPAWM